MVRTWAQKTQPRFGSVAGAPSWIGGMAQPAAASFLLRVQWMNLPIYAPPLAEETGPAPLFELLFFGTKNHRASFVSQSPSEHCWLALAVLTLSSPASADQVSWTAMASPLPGHFPPH